MSYILDALKKSAQERELGRILRPVGDSEQLLVRLKRPIWPLAIGSALLLIVFLTSLRVWWDTGSRDSVVERTLPADAVSLNTAVSEMVKPPASSPAPASVTAKPSMRALAEQTRITQRKPEPNKRRQTGVSSAKPSNSAKQATSLLPSTPVSERSPVYQDPAAIPFLRQMPSDFRRKIPDMVLNVHLYSADESENLVYINNRQYRTGERVEGKFRLEEIVEEGVVLNYDGVRFKLPRPN